MYLPLDGASSADAPYGFVFELGVDDGPPPRLELALLAFGEPVEQQVRDSGWHRSLLSSEVTC